MRWKFSANVYVILRKWKFLGIHRGFQYSMKRYNEIDPMPIESKQYSTCMKEQSIYRRILILYTITMASVFAFILSKGER